MRTDASNTERPPWLDLALGLLWVGPAWEMVGQLFVRVEASPVSVAIIGLVLFNVVVYRTLSRDDPQAWGGAVRSLRPLARPLGLVYLFTVLTAVLTLSTFGLEYGDPRLVTGGVVEGALRGGLALAGVLHLLRQRPDLHRPVALVGSVFAAGAGFLLAGHRWYFTAAPAHIWLVAVAVGYVHSVGAALLMGPRPPTRPRFHRWLAEDSPLQKRLELPAAGAHRDRHTITRLGRSVMLVLVGLTLSLGETDVVGTSLAIVGMVLLLTSILRWCAATLSSAVVTITPTYATVTRRFLFFRRTRTIEARRLAPRVELDAEGPMLVLGNGTIVAADVPAATLVETMNRIRVHLAHDTDTDAHTAQHALASAHHPVPGRSTGRERTRLIGDILAGFAVVGVLYWAAATPHPEAATPIALAGGIAGIHLLWHVAQRELLNRIPALRPSPSRRPWLEPEQADVPPSVAHVEMPSKGSTKVVPPTHRAPANVQS